MGIVVVASTSTAINTGNVIQENNLILVAQTPIAVENGKNFLVSGNSIDGAPFGHCISVASYEGNSVPQGHHVIVENSMGLCAGNGISLYAAPDTTLTHNRVADNWVQICGEDCIALEAGSGAVMTNNKVTGNEVSFSEICGITLGAYPLDAFGASVNNNLVRENTVFRNLSGICLNPKADNNRLVKNIAQDQTADGIVVFGNGNKLLGNSAHDNDVNGIEVSGNNNGIYSNSALRNGSYDLDDQGTDNRWRNNTYENKSW